MRTYPEIGVPDPHHPLTHHRGNAEWIEKVTKVNALHMELFAGFIAKMKATPDGDGTLLDHSVDRLRQRPQRRQPHTHEDLPVLIVGKGGGLKLGHHIVYPKDTPMTNLRSSTSTSSSRTRPRTAAYLAEMNEPRHDRRRQAAC